MRTFCLSIFLILCFFAKAQVASLKTPDEHLIRILQRSIEPLNDTPGVAIFDVKKENGRLTIVPVFSSLKNVTFFSKLHTQELIDKIPDGFHRIVPFHYLYVNDGETVPTQPDSTALAEAEKLLSSITQRFTVTEVLIMTGYPPSCIKTTMPAPVSLNLPTPPSKLKEEIVPLNRHQ